MTPMRNLPQMKNTLDELRSERDRTLSAYMGLVQECAMLELVVDSMEEREGVGEVSAPSGQLTEDSTEESEPENDESVSGYPRDIDISAASNLADRLRLLAMHLPDGIFNVDRAAQWMLEVGASNSEVGNLVSRIYKEVKKRDDFRLARGCHLTSLSSLAMGQIEPADIISFRQMGSERLP